MRVRSTPWHRRGHHPSNPTLVAGPGPVSPLYRGKRQCSHVQQQRREAEQQQRHAAWVTTYEAIHALHTQGAPVATIAQQLGISRPTVYAYLRRTRPPSPRSPQRSKPGSPKARKGPKILARFTPVATEACIAMHATVSCRHRTRPCPVTRLAWTPGLAYTLHERTVSRGRPAARAAGRLVPTARCSTGDRPWPRHPRSDAMPKFPMSR